METLPAAAEAVVVVAATRFFEPLKGQVPLAPGSVPNGSILSLILDWEEWAVPLRLESQRCSFFAYISVKTTRDITLSY